MGEACAICAEAESTCIVRFARGDAYMQILETVYFTIIFVLRSIHELAYSARVTANRHIYMVLRTLTYWVDAIVYRCLCDSRVQWGRFDMDQLKHNIAFHSLPFVCVLVRHCRYFLFLYQ